MSARSFTSRAVILPSLVTETVRSWIWSRPWWAVSSDSERVSVHFTGLPSFWATSRVTTSSGATAILPPKPPPTSGAMTRSLCSGRPRVSASIVLRMCGTCVADHMTSCSPVGSTTVERGSMKTGTRRCWRKRRVTTIWSSAFSALADGLGGVAPGARLARVEHPLGVRVRAQVRVHEGGAVLQRLLHVQDRLELVVVDLDLLGRVLGDRHAARQRRRRRPRRRSSPACRPARDAAASACPW